MAASSLPMNESLSCELNRAISDAVITMAGTPSLKITSADCAL